MTLIPVEKPEDFLLAQQFLIPHEETCVSLASLVRRKSDKLIFISDSEELAIVPPSTSSEPEVVSTNSSTTDHILGILNLDSTIYHCIPDPDLIEFDFLSLNLPYLLKKPVRCISGEKKSTDFLIKIFSSGNFDKLNHPAQVYDYKMMKFPLAERSLSGVEGRSRSTEPILSGDEEIIRCTEHDMEILHPLQKDYLKEEVAVPGRKLTDAEVDITLRQILKNQLCFALTCDGEIVAKANTNAIGLNNVQIGGVYTHPLYRRNGYAVALVKALCNRVLHAHKQPVLFVKEKNTPAFILYQKLGFTECGRYTIVYY